MCYNRLLKQFHTLIIKNTHHRYQDTMFILLHEEQIEDAVEIDKKLHHYQVNEKCCNIYV